MGATSFLRGGGLVVQPVVGVGVGVGDVVGFGVFGGVGVAGDGEGESTAVGESIFANRDDRIRNENRG